MQKSDLPVWASVAEIISAVAVVFSLLYVGYEISRNTEIMDSEQNLAIFESMRSWEQLLIVDEELADLYVRAPSEFETFSNTEQLQYRFFIAQYAGIWEQAFEGHQDHLIGTETWISWNNAFLPEIRQVAVIWPEISLYYSGEFQQHMENEIDISSQNPL
jgi:hypothetical protein